MQYEIEAFAGKDPQTAYKPGSSAFQAVRALFKTIPPVQ